MNFKIEFVELKSSKKPFEDFILNLPIKERARIFETINYFLDIKNNDPEVKEKLSKHLERGIFELRTFLIDKVARIFYSYYKGEKIVITYGIIKKVKRRREKKF